MTYNPDNDSYIRKIEHRIGVLALWGNIRNPDSARKCSVLDYGPVQGTRMIKLTDQPKRRNGELSIEWGKGVTICAELGDVWERS